MGLVVELLKVQDPMNKAFLKEKMFEEQESTKRN